MNKKFDSFIVSVELVCMCERKSSIKQKIKPEISFIACRANQKFSQNSLKCVVLFRFLVYFFYTSSHLTYNKGITNNTKEKHE